MTPHHPPENEDRRKIHSRAGLGPPPLLLRPAPSLLGALSLLPHIPPPWCAGIAKRPLRPSPPTVTVPTGPGALSTPKPPQVLSIAGAILVGRAGSHTSHARDILSYAERASAICTHQPLACNPFRSLHSQTLVHDTYRSLHGSGSACLSACEWSSTLVPRSPRQAAECPPDRPAAAASLRPAPRELGSFRFFTGPSN